MKRVLMITAMLLTVLLCRTPTYGAMTYGLTHYETNRAYIGAGNFNDPLWNFINEVETTLDGTSGVTSIIFTPGTEPSTPAEGMLYYNAAGNNLKLYTGSAFVDIDVSGASSLNTAYGVGSKIEAGTLEVEIEVADSSNNPALRLDFDDATTNAQDVLIIDNAGDDADAVSIQINGTAGDDIRGSGDVWSVGQDGAAILVAIDVVGDITLENDEVIKNDNNGEIEFGNGTEDTAFSWSTNSLDISSDTGVVEVDWGTVDSHVGLNALAFDVAVANTITQAGTGAADDLTIQQTASGQDASLILQSTGTGTDALSLISSVGDTKINSADNLDIDAADNITVDLADGGYTLTIGGASNGKYIMTAADTWSAIAVDTITLQNTEASKNITINSVLGSVVIEGEEDAASAVLITADGGTSTTLKIHNDTGTSTTEGAASLQLTSDVGSIELLSGLDAADAISLIVDSSTAAGILIFNDTGIAAAATTETDGSIQLLSDDGGIGIVSTANLADAIRIEANGGASETVALSSVQGTGVASIDIDSTLGGITISANAAGKNIEIDSVLGSISIEAEENAADAILIDADGAATTTLRIVSTTGTSVTEDAAALQLSAIAGGISIQSDGDLDDAVVIRADGGTTAEMTIHNDQGTSESAVEILSDAGGMDLTAATGKNMDLTAGQITLLSNEDATSAIALTTNTGTAETIVITNTQGDTDAAITLNAAAGGIELTTADAGVMATTATFQHREQYYAIGAGIVSASEIIVVGGQGLLCVGLAAGAAEIGTTEGFSASDTDTDFTRFAITLPSTFVDTGTQADLIVTFDVHEQDTDTCVIDVRIFEYDGNANVAAIITDTMSIANAQARQLESLVTNAAGIGNEADLQAGDVLIFELTGTDTDADFNLYGMKLSYRVGLHATE